MQRSPHKLVSLLLLVSVPIALLFPLQRTRAQSLPDKYPRIANYYLTPTISVADARRLARWDVLVLGAEVQYTSPDIFPVLRAENPDIILLAYVLSEEVPNAHEAITDAANPLKQLFDGIEDGWWLRDHAGGRHGYWPNTHMLNVTNSAPVVNGMRWNTYLPTFVHDHIMATGLWNGVFYDNVFPTISWVNGGDLDLDQNGSVDATATMDAAWRDGMTTMLTLSRQLEGPDAFIIGNGDTSYLPPANGRLIEEFPSVLDGGWPGAMEKYFAARDAGYPPPLIILNGKVVTQSDDDVRRFRYVFASTLLGSGFVSIDDGAERHASLQWYDEYEVSLGSPLGRAFRIGSTAAAPRAGVWEREFANGYAFVNATDASVTVALPEALATLRATATMSDQDSAILVEVTLAPRDGIVLFKRRTQPQNIAYINGTYTKIYPGLTSQNHQEFFSYATRYAGGAQILQSDLDRNGTIETVVAEGPRIRVLSTTGRVVARFAPYGPRYRGTVRFALGDVNGDGAQEIVTGTGAGYAPHVLVFSLQGRRIAPGFFAGKERLRTGVNVALGDIDGDGTLEIVTAAANRGNGKIRIYDGNGRLRKAFRAYGRGFHGGISVAAGDLTGDARAEIVTGPSSGGGPHIRFWNGQGREIARPFFAFDKAYRGGVAITVTDYNNDDQNDLFISAVTLY